MRNQSNLFYDTEEAIDFIADDTGIDPTIIEAVLYSDLKYMQSIGIIEEELEL